MTDHAATRGDDRRFRQQRRQRIRALLDQGATRKQIAREFAQTYRVSRLLAFRWAHDLTLMEAAGCYNDVAGDADPRMEASRLSKYESWPHGTRGIQPRVGMLRTFAQVYHCAPGDLLDGTDYTDEHEEAFVQERDVGHDRRAPRAPDQGMPGGTLVVAAGSAGQLGPPRDGANAQRSRYPDGAAVPQPANGESSDLEDQANRREAVKTFAVLAAGATRARGLLLSAEAHNVGPLTLDEYDDSVQWLSQNAGVHPLATLIATADRNAEEVAGLLWQGKHSGKQRQHLELLTGQLAYLQGDFAFRLGEYGIARTHLRLARHYGNQLDDHLLLASVANVESYLALYQGRFDQALRIVRDAQQYATQHTAARLAALEARAFAGMRPISHRELVELVERAEAALPARPTFEPGAVAPFGPEMYLLYAATASVRAGSERAVEFAGEAVREYETLEASNGERFHYEHLALARLDFAMALLQSKQWDPGEAAGLGIQALAVPRQFHTDPVKRRVVELLRMFHGKATVRELPAVKELAEAARGYRAPALPAPPPRPALGSS